MSSGGSYQPRDKDLTYIARTLQGTSTGVLKKTAADTWALDANLQAIGAITSPDGKFIVGTAGGWTSATITAAGMALLDDADAAAQRVTLGLGNAAVRFPFYDSNTTLDTISLNSDSSFPFYDATGAADNIPMVT